MGAVVVGNVGLVGSETGGKGGALMGDKVKIGDMVVDVLLGGVALMVVVGDGTVVLLLVLLL